MDGPDETLRAAMSAEASGNREEAITILKDARKRWPQHATFAVRLAESYRAKGDHKSAVKVLKKVIKNHPERLDAVLTSARSNLVLGKAKIAERQFMRALSIGMDPIEGVVSISRCWMLRGRNQEAWTSASAEFKRTGAMHRGLHGILTEIGPKLGHPVPAMDPIAEQTVMSPNRNQEDSVISEVHAPSEIPREIISQRSTTNASDLLDELLDSPKKSQESQRDILDFEL
ncbi:MAG: tetratricopeptide repeat protein [Candidatus Poseidoniales archaeon]|nr:MAG: hypothetical protein CMA23_006800 [Euryarchaeota archaeon]RCH73323.1 MAG: tetratricopeptide repeat protein [Candidatus Poseidoniales archaeon]|tara:strand:+ start:1088 stop:1777 length:690 start_codon:yes stop_codon:yes gene_type:complete